jgi:hypothetical protein
MVKTVHIYRHINLFNIIILKKYTYFVFNYLSQFLGNAKHKCTGLGKQGFTLFMSNIFNSNMFY